MLAPPLSQWRHYSDPEYQRIVVPPYSSADIPGLFLQYFSRVVERYCATGDFICISQEDSNYLEIIQRLQHRISANVQKTNTCNQATNDQIPVIDAVRRVTTGHRRRPLVLTADRGRGKSAAIGMALGMMLRDDNLSTGSPETIFQFLVTAPSLLSVERLFAHCADTLGVAMDEPGILHWQGASVRYCLPEQVMDQKNTAMVLIVDEAAAIGTPLLNLWLDAFPRIVFATTIHGYEGSGQGFAIRFQETLKKNTPQYKHLSLSVPIRWGKGDVVELFLNDAFLLAVDNLAVEDDGPEESDHHSAESFIESPVVIQHIERTLLIEQESILRALFGLLVSAHYKTTPGDLRNLLDGPNLEVFVARCDGQIVGALLLAREGALDTELSEAIWQGRRRPRGHVVPQTLAVQCGYKDGLTQKSARIIRVAVTPSMQRDGIGQQLVEGAREFAQRQGFDWLGSSFGATLPLINFWRRCGLRPVRVGIALNAASASYSVLMLMPLHDKIAEAYVGLQQDFVRQFIAGVANNYQRMPVLLLIQLLVNEKNGTEYSTEHNVDDTASICPVDVGRVQRDVRGFLAYQWPYDVVFPSLRQWFLGQLNSLEDTLAIEEISILADLLIRQKSLEQVALSWGEGGQKSLVKKIKAIVHTLNS
ncbi:MAG: hypothetical protein COA99_19860 [Moraxellaceae bacterium]|nr:MAG: hypothetical protein COA99_19860 [Moraxellaceae bacterium]